MYTCNVVLSRLLNHGLLDALLCNNNFGLQMTF